MTLDEAMDQALDHYDRVTTNNLINACRLFVQHGATEPELDAAMARLRSDIEIERVEFETKLRAWFLRDGAPLQ